MPSILEYYRAQAYDPEGGFYASQDADIGVLREGGYYVFEEKRLKGFLRSITKTVFSTIQKV